MSISIIVGGQFGSEGKGKFTKYWAERMKADIVVRVGGPNSGHTVYDDNGKEFKLRTLPSTAISHKRMAVLPAGSYIQFDQLMEEIALTNIPRSKLVIDPNAVIIRQNQINTERFHYELGSKIGSTECGIGAALANRVLRGSGTVTFAKDVPKLRPYLEDTKNLLRQYLQGDTHIIIEGTQGYGLSNLHTEYYPYATARDTTAAAFLSETGLSPLDVEYVVMVIRSYPIRVGGNSGPLPKEITWEEVTKKSGSLTPLIERTTVTDKIRRVAKFDADVVRGAIDANNPNVIVMNHLDYIDMTNADQDILSNKQQEFIISAQLTIGRKIDFCGNGVNTIIER